MVSLGFPAGGRSEKSLSERDIENQVSEAARYTARAFIVPRDWPAQHVQLVSLTPALPHATFGGIFGNVFSE